jgi:hypothetical protein
VTRIIPPVSAFELGVFRVLLGVGLAVTIHDLRLPDTPFPRELHLAVHPLASAEWIHGLAERTAVVSQIEVAAVALALVFAIGIATRLTFTALVALLTVWTLVRLTHTGAHAWSAVLVALWAWLPVRWGDGFSVDAIVRRARGRHLTHPSARSAAYGYALWLPGLVFTTAMLAAAIAKLRQSGFAWITNGSVKYFFVIDAERAPTDWGLWVASHHWVAVALSAGAIITEASLILALLFARPLYRLPFALAGAALLGGFWAFQHEFWYGWWLLFLAFFVPWPSTVRLVRREAPPASLNHRLGRWQVAAIVIVAALQAVASWRRVELAPMMSDYPMYSTTFASIDDFERRAGVPPIYHFTVRFADGTERYATADLERLSIDDVVRDVHVRLSEGRPRPDEAQVINAAAARLGEHYMEPVTAIIVSIDRRGFDFARGRFGWLEMGTRVRELPVPFRLD